MGYGRGAGKEPLAIQVPQEPKHASSPNVTVNLDAAELGRRLFMSAQEEAQFREPLYWKPKSAKHMVNKEVLNWTNKAIMSNPRLLQIKGDEDSMVMREVLRRRDSLNSGDVFILDTGNMLYIWHGEHANKYEKEAAFMVVDHICKSRGINTHHVILEEGVSDDCENFWKEIRDRPLFLGFQNYLASKYKISPPDIAGSDSEVSPFQKKLYDIGGNGRIGRQRRWLAKRNKSTSLHNQFAKRKLESSKTYLLDDGFRLWIWKGQDSSVSDDEACREATKYLKEKGNHSWRKQSHNRPASLPILLVKENEEPEEFHENFKYVRRKGYW